MKMIDGYRCRSFGNENTNLRWRDIPEKVQNLMSSSDGYDIWEREVNEEDEDGNITDTTYLYTIWNRNERHVPWERIDWWTAEELIDRLVEDADSLAESDAPNVAEDFFWTLESWGSEYPPENADEIIEKANEKLTEYARQHYWDVCREDDLHDYSDRLWERYCATGAVEG